MCVLLYSQTPIVLAFFWLALKTTFLGFYMSQNKEAKSLTFRRGAEVSQVVGPFSLQPAARDLTRLGSWTSRFQGSGRRQDGLGVKVAIGFRGSGV